VWGFDDGAKLLKAAEQHGLEGIVSKRQASAYRSGPSRDWVKVKTEAWRGEQDPACASRAIAVGENLCGRHWLTKELARSRRLRGLQWVAWSVAFGLDYGRAAGERSVMQVTGVRTTIEMFSGFREPYLQLGVQASDVMEHFHRAIRTPDRPALSDMIVVGGNTYADLKLTINTFWGGGRIDIRPGVLLVELRNINRERNHSEIAKEHLQLCEDTARRALKGVEIAERMMRASMWVACEGGKPAMEAFIAEKGNAALKLDQGPYKSWTKEFTLQFTGLDAVKATKIGLGLQRSAGEGDLFVQIDHTQYGSPVVTKSPKEQFEEAEQEFKALMRHVGLELKDADAGQP
jgi:hypothetical protein